MKDNELSKAKKLLSSNIKMSDISKHTGISRVSLSHYKTGNTDINKARWSIIHALAKEWDNYQFHQTLNSNYGEYNAKLIAWFTDLKDYKEKNLLSNKPLIKSVYSLLQIIESNPQLLNKMYQAYQGENGNG